MAKKYQYQETIEIQDSITGEIKEMKKFSKIQIPTEENYIKIYIQHINYLNNLPQGLDPLIYELMKYMSYGNQIVINSAIKREIAEVLGKSFNTINQYLTKLVHYDVLIRKDTGVYYLNPLLYGKGDWKQIMELREELELTIQYAEKDYRITHKFKETPNLK